ncbi:hypothetical protein AAMO2058_001578400 [Amorphochlora amoebiformis]
MAATAIYLALNRITTEGVCKLMDLAISDLADEDFVVNKRKQPLPALIFGSFSFLARIGQSLGPIIGFWLISSLSERNPGNFSSTDTPTTPGENPGIPETNPGSGGSADLLKMAKESKISLG